MKKDLESNLQEQKDENRNLLQLNERLLQKNLVYKVTLDMAKEKYQKQIEAIKEEYNGIKNQLSQEKNTNEVFVKNTIKNVQSICQKQINREKKCRK